MTGRSQTGGEGSASSMLVCINYNYMFIDYTPHTLRYAPKTNSSSPKPETSLICLPSHCQVQYLPEKGTDCVLNNNKLMSKGFGQYKVLQKDKQPSSLFVITCKNKSRARSLSASACQTRHYGFYSSAPIMEFRKLRLGKEQLARGQQPDPRPDSKSKFCTTTLPRTRSKHQP